MSPAPTIMTFSIEMKYNRLVNNKRYPLQLWDCTSSLSQCTRLCHPHIYAPYLHPATKTQLTPSSYGNCSNKYQIHHHKYQIRHHKYSIPLLLIQLVCYPNPRISLSVRACVTKRPRLTHYLQANTLSNG